MQALQKRSKTQDQIKQEMLKPSDTSAPANSTVVRTLSSLEPAKKQGKKSASEAIAQFKVAKERIFIPSSEQQLAVSAKGVFAVRQRLVCYITGQLASKCRHQTNPAQIQLSLAERCRLISSKMAEAFS